MCVWSHFENIVFVGGSKNWTVDILIHNYVVCVFLMNLCTFEYVNIQNSCCSVLYNQVTSLSGVLGMHNYDIVTCC
jgi:hypothetical protein